MAQKNNQIRQPRRWLLAVGLLPLLALALPAQTDRTVSIQGSELLGPAVGEAWAAFAETQAWNVKLAFRGSRPARDRLEAGAIDMAVLIRDPGEGELPEDWVVLPLAYAAALVVAPKDLDLEQLSFADLARIYSANSAVATTRWGDFGAQGKWEYTPISMHLQTAASGLALELFSHEVLGGQPLKGSVRRHDELALLETAMAGDEGPLGVVSWLDPEHPKFKALLVAPAGDQVAFGPSAENMVAGDYPLALPLRLAVARDRVADLLPVLQFWFRDEMSAALREDRLMPLPRGERNQQIFDLEVIE